MYSASESFPSYNMETTVFLIENLRYIFFTWN